ncbi:uncharacterized protein LOC113391569 isoform X1 [Vanessa tameamea]|uniref:Uncharacterized protein LOC113391569 isoform X1 n=1 Tax=Vanessa tameamea TaxID=334116 RepID=A0A8B8HEV0_VANTA|nr:uncharacterized protein LOC113391569 isoform X1 [Vanessa tameamea]
MGYYCTVPQCTSLAGKTKNVKFHRFPRDVIMADKWNLILKRGKPYTKYSKVCSLHFTQADYNVTTMGKNKGQWKTLSKDAVPSQNLPKLNPDGTVMVIRKSRTMKYKESKKEDHSIGDKVEKWSNVSQTTLSLTGDGLPPEQQDNNLVYRLQALNSMANNMTQPQSIPQNQAQSQMKPKKQDAIMQTDPVLSEEDENPQNYSESEKSMNQEMDYSQFKESYDPELNKYDMPKDFSKLADDYIPQTNEEYNKEAEKYALERKSHNSYEKIDYQKSVLENGYPKIQDVYSGYIDKEYQNRPDFVYQSPYPDSVEILRNQQHNLQILQEQHRINENQNFFNENHIKQEIDFGNDEEKFLYEQNKDQIDQNAMYDSQRRVIDQQRILEQIQQQVKQEPETPSGCDGALQPQSSPYFPPAGGAAGAEGCARPGPELLIAKQNALAAHTQLWQNTMKRPFFYSESPHYNSSQLLHRYEVRNDDLSRILQ